MDFGTALSIYLCFLAVVMVVSQLLYLFKALRTGSASSPGLALSHSVLLPHDDKGPDDHGDGSEDDLDENQSIHSTRC